MDTSAIDRWLDGYLAAWRSDDRAAVEALFTEDSAYFTAPYRSKLSREALVEYWLGENESQLAWSAEYRVLAREGDLYVVGVVVRYPDGEDGASPALVYHDIWLITLASDGRAEQFVEYFMAEEPGPTR